MKSSIIISIVWFIFTLIFGALGYSHWEKSKQEIPKFKITKVLGHGANISVGKDSIEKPLQDFANEFNNSYLPQYNKSNSEANRNAAFGYFAASLTFLVAIIVEWVQFRKARKTSPNYNSRSRSMLTG